MTESEPITISHRWQPIANVPSRAEGCGTSETKMVRVSRLVGANHPLRSLDDASWGDFGIPTANLLAFNLSRE